jgi:hypothetical protein
LVEAVVVVTAGTMAVAVEPRATGEEAEVGEVATLSRTTSVSRPESPINTPSARLEQPTAELEETLGSEEQAWRQACADPKVVIMAGTGITGLEEQAAKLHLA